MRAWMVQLHRGMAHWSAKSAKALCMWWMVVPQSAVALFGEILCPKARWRHMILKYEINKLAPSLFEID